MKTFNLIMKIVVALAAVAGAVYVVATYGDKIVAWAKNLIHNCPCCKKQDACEDEDFEPEDKIIIMRNGTIKVPADATEETEAAEEAEAAEAPAEAPAEAAAEEAPAAEDDTAVTASDDDFEA